MDGKVNVTATGQLVGGDATYSMGGRPGSGGAGLYLDKGTIQNAGLIFGGMGGYNDGAAPPASPQAAMAETGRAAQWPHGQ